MLVSNGLAVLLGLIALIFCKNPKARDRAWALFVGGLLITVLGVFLLIILMHEFSRGR